MPLTFNIVHKKQTRANDCWYACIQMIRTHREGHKTKAVGGGVKTHRNAMPSIVAKVWGNPLGEHDDHFAQILQENNLRLLDSQSFSLWTLNSVQQGVELYGPTIVGGDFGKAGRVPFTNKWLMKGMGHYIVLVGTDSQTNELFVHDPWRSHMTRMPWDKFSGQVWRGGGDQTVIANQA